MKITSQSKPARLPLGDQFTEFEKSTRNEFDENGWDVFTDRTNGYINDLYVGTRRECISRSNNEVTLKYSGKDVEAGIHALGLPTALWAQTETIPSSDWGHVWQPPNRHCWILGLQ
jgi:hypothetical protein